MGNLTSAELNRLAKNTGCRLHDDCLTCTRPKCIYDEKSASPKAERRRAEIRRLSESLDTAEVAKKLSISERTVQRALKEQ